MKVRMVRLIYLITLVAFLFIGCEQKESVSQGDNLDTIEEIATDEITATAAPEAEAITVKYPYEQDLNILEDNYRNYYEIFVYSFYDSDGDGIGDLKGIISKLDYIHEMGFNGIWLMPIMPSTTYHKYDVTDYYSIDPQYGTLEDFQELLEECHKRNIRLIIDFVFNHTSAKHPWFTEAVKYLQTLEEGEEPDLTECPFVGYYHFVKETNGNNSYHKVGGTDWYYEGVFWDQMPDLALENPALRKEIEDITKYWMDMGVDGFRLDAVKEYYTGDTGKNVEVLTWFSDYVASIDDEAFVVGECWDTSSMISSYYKSGITSIFNYPLAQYNGVIASSVRRLGTASAKSLAKSIMDLHQMYGENNPNYIDSPFLSNHDNTRISAQYANDANQMKMAAGILLTQKGSPFVYYGEEIGMNSMGDKDENKRLPMNWSATDLTGMTKAPEKADEVEQKFPSLEEQLEDPLSIVNYYKRALRIRNENPEIARGEQSIIEEIMTKEVCGFLNEYEGREIAIIYNLGREATTVDLKAAGLEQKAISGYLTVDGSEVTLSENILDMPAYSIVILK